MYLPFYLSFAHRACFLLSYDLADYLVLNKKLITTSNFECSPTGSVEDIQIGLLMSSLGISPLHDHRITDVSLCFLDTLVLVDIDFRLMKDLDSACRKDRTLCTLLIHNLSIQWYLNFIQNHPTSPIGYNNLAILYAIDGNFALSIEYLKLAQLKMPLLNSIEGNLKHMKKLQKKGCNMKCREKLHNSIKFHSRQISVPSHVENPDYFRHEFSNILSVF